MNENCASIADGPVLDAAVARAAKALLALQRDDGHFVFELEADATIPAEYVLLGHYLGETPNADLERKIGAYLRRIQCSHGGWALYHGGDFDLSATVKAYFALKMIGDPPEAPHMRRAREAVLAHGGAARSNVFTRILLALYGDIDMARDARHSGRNDPAAALVSDPPFENVVLGAHRAGAVARLAALKPRGSQSAWRPHCRAVRCARRAKRDGGRRIRIVWWAAFFHGLVDVLLKTGSRLALRACEKRRSHAVSPSSPNG